MADSSPPPTPPRTTQLVVQAPVGASDEQLLASMEQPLRVVVQGADSDQATQSLLERIRHTYARRHAPTESYRRRSHFDEAPGLTEQAGVASEDVQETMSGLEAEIIRLNRPLSARRQAELELLHREADRLAEIGRAMEEAEDIDSPSEEDVEEGDSDGWDEWDPDCPPPLFSVDPYYDGSDHDMDTVDDDESRGFITADDVEEGDADDDDLIRFSVNRFSPVTSRLLIEAQEEQWRNRRSHANVIHDRVMTNSDDLREDDDEQDEVDDDDDDNDDDNDDFSIMREISGATNPDINAGGPQRLPFADASADPRFFPRFCPGPTLLNPISPASSVNALASADLRELKPDPSSARSPTSFLRPGMAFSGHQSFASSSFSASSATLPLPFPHHSHRARTGEEAEHRRRREQDAALQHVADALSQASNGPIPLAVPPLVPLLQHNRLQFPDPSASYFGWSDPRDEAAVDILELRARLAELNETRRRRAQQVLPEVFEPLSDSAEDVADAVELTRRARIAHALHGEATARDLEERTAREEDSLRREAEAVLARWTALDGRRAASTGGNGSGKEQWNVRVVITAYDAEEGTVGGLMHAIGVPSRGNGGANGYGLDFDDVGAATKEDVTTFFSGEIVDVASSSSPSSSIPDGRGLWSKKWAPPAPRKTIQGLRIPPRNVKNDPVLAAAEYWCQLGPFRGLTAAELLKRQEDVVWLTDLTRGWILMRWKELDFVNTQPGGCTLSIDGWYLVALERSTGIVEGECWRL